jgi:hypothetical protein
MIRHRDPQSIYIRELPGNLKGRFKAFCAARNISMKDKIIQLLKESLHGSEYDGRPTSVDRNTTKP